MRRPMAFSAGGGVAWYARCRVAMYNSGRFIGRRPTRRPTERSISCALPLGWFDINKAVRFRVWGRGLRGRARSGTDRRRAELSGLSPMWHRTGSGSSRNPG